MEEMIDPARAAEIAGGLMRKLDLDPEWVPGPGAEALGCVAAALVRAVEPIAGVVAEAWVEAMKLLGRLPPSAEVFRDCTESIMGAPLVEWVEFLGGDLSEERLVAAGLSAGDAAEVMRRVGAAMGVAAPLHALEAAEVPWGTDDGVCMEAVAWLAGRGMFSVAPPGPLVAGPYANEAVTMALDAFGAVAAPAADGSAGILEEGGGVLRENGWEKIEEAQISWEMGK